NNLRDIVTDKAAGKHTIAVRLGVRGTRIEYATMLVIAGAAPIVFWIVGWLDWTVVLTILWWPIAVNLWNQVSTRTGPALNPTLGNTGRGLLLYSVVLATTLILSP
ncbi:MAG TPA: UbiA family prenyltransferase, partial [Thermomicrobiales bacterium]|nr:UbiA family prenyltransferase [Thermomicrobiales bacterium]